jgi:hypothetical protein
MTDLLILGGWRRLANRFRGLRARRGDSLSGCIAEVNNVKLGVNVEPGFGGTLLILLEVGDNVVEDVHEVITEMSVKSNLRKPEGETRATFWCIRCAD